MQFNSSKIWELNKDNLLQRVSNAEILKYYIPGEGLSYNVLCNFHRESTPSMCVNLVKGIFKCFGCGVGGDGITFVQKKYNLTFYEALQVISNDMGLSSINYKKVPLEVLGIPLAQIKNIPTTIQIKERSWLTKDVAYWKQFGISKELCIRYNIYPISHYWVNDYMFIIKAGELAYAFLEKGKFQIYQPYADKSKKWFSNTGQMVYGYDQLPPYGELLIITSSKKDILTLTSLGYNAVSPNNEGTALPVDTYEDLNNRFDRIVIFFNNDHQGLKAAHLMGEDLGLDFIYIPMDYKETDPSDFHKSFGEGKTREMIKILLDGTR